MKHLLLLPVCLFCYVCLWAKPFPFKSADTVVISAPVYHNLYLAGKYVMLNAPVFGDVYVTGGTVIINDTVSCDVCVAGGKLVINGVVCDDLRCIAGEVQIPGGQVAGETLACGGAITVGKKAIINQLYAVGGAVTIEGTVAENNTSYARAFVLNGSILRNAEIKGENLTINGRITGNALLSAGNRLEIGNNAVLEGDTRYWCPGNTAAVKQQIGPGNAFADPALEQNEGRWYFLGLTTLVAFILYMGMVLLVIIAIQYLFRNITKAAGDSFYQSFFSSLLYGLLFYIGTPVAIVLVLCTVIGIPLGLTALLLYVLALLLSTALAAVVVANWLNNQTGKNWPAGKLIPAALGIFILLKILTFTPAVGWVLAIIITGAASGAVLKNIHWRRRVLKAATVD